MRILIISFFICHCVICSGQSNDYIYPELDKTILKVWSLSKRGDGKAVLEQAKNIESVWKKVRTSFPGSPKAGPVCHSFACNIDMKVVDIVALKRTTDHEVISALSFQIMIMLRDLRKLIGQHNYPLDHLLNMKEVYDEIHTSIHDQMLSLYDWCEFEDMNVSLNELWNTYNYTSPAQISTFLSTSKLSNHEILKETFQDCIEEFNAAIDTGWKDNFDLPCDKMGSALDALILLYKD